ncbi:MAG: hypothetical protein AAF566_05625 [Pseudomonadota bacterium]
MYKATGETLPVSRVGRVEEIAEASMFLMIIGHTTGVVLDVDGGQTIRQRIVA